MSRIRALMTIAVFLTASSLPAPAFALQEFFTAKLRPGNETPTTLSTTGSGLFAAQLDESETVLLFALLYDTLEGGTVTGAHIHLGRAATTGGIVIHFCGTGGKPACPAIPGALQGTATAADVVAVAAQGVAAGDLAAVIRAMRRGDTYVNVHTTTFPGGEIRGQIE
jgi:hypothetical protein